MIEDSSTIEDIKPSTDRWPGTLIIFSIAGGITASVFIAFFVICMCMCAPFLKD